ncbi:MAG TPA: GyrI-like domain-containing protein [Tepidisphaeraceae bacterium]|jgi:effector-binding domain-containing protein|nr:GyrI-like domain-containing protein [Tepidisphaeraceae bacterium]
MEYQIQLKTLPSLPLAVVRRQATPQDLPKIIPQACGLVWKSLQSKQIPGAGRHVALYLDNQINLEIGVELNAPFTSDGQIIPSSTPAGPVATTTHFGPYNLLHQAHHALRQWCSTHNHQLAGPNWEIYGHWTDACNTNPSQIRTDIFYLLKPATHQC